MYAEFLVRVDRPFTDFRSGERRRAHGNPRVVRVLSALWCRERIWRLDYNTAHISHITDAENS